MTTAPANPDPALSGELREIAETIRDGNYVEASADMHARAADALDAFRAVAEALVAREANRLACRLCEEVGLCLVSPHPPYDHSDIPPLHAEDCPVALARAALDAYPEACTDA